MATGSGPAGSSIRLSFPGLSIATTPGEGFKDWVEVAEWWHKIAGLAEDLADSAATRARLAADPARQVVS